MKLVLWVLPVAALGILFMDLAAYAYIGPVLESQLESSFRQNVRNNGELINTWLTTLMLEPETIAATPAAKNINESFGDFDLQNINRYRILQEKYPDIFQDIYGSNREGVYHTVIGENGEIGIFQGDIANRPYFISIMNGGPTQITPPLISRTTGIPTVFIVAPIVDGRGSPAGLVGSGISLEFLQKVIRGMRSERRIDRFILTSEGTLVAHSRRDTFTGGLAHISEIYPDTRLAGELTSPEGGRFSSSPEGRESLFFSEPIPVAGWNFITAVPAEDLFSPVRHLLVFLILIALATALSVSVLVFFIMDRLIRPLRDLTERTKSIALGNLGMGAVPEASNDEIGILAGSFNAMIGNINDSVLRLRESENNYRSIFENSIEGIMQTTLKGEVLSANPAIVRMLRFDSQEEFIGYCHNSVEQFYADPEDRAHFIEELLKEGVVIQKEIRARCSDGGILWVSLTSFLVRDDGGTPLRIETFISDISRRREMEEERTRLQQDLAQAQKLEAIGQLAGGVAHDFNNMLAVIMGYSELSLRDLDRESPHYRAFSDIFDAAEHSALLTRQLLAFARKQTVSPVILGMNEVIGSMLSLLRRLISEDIQLTFLPGDRLWNVLMDPNQIGQILTNLCVNARDSIGGRGEITIGTENRLIGGEEYVCLSIGDTGSGMDRETQAHIFEPFFTTKEQGKGTGLGLATVYGIVKQNGGRIDLSSEIGKGTLFRICLPGHPDGGPSRGGDAPPPSSLTSPVDVLLVEDDPRLLNITRDILEKLGCRVIALPSPLDALAAAEDRTQTFRLLLTDMVMPGMNGYELSRRILELRPEVKCLFMSGYGFDILEGKEGVADNYHIIQKPFSLERMAEMIKEAMAEE